MSNFLLGMLVMWFIYPLVKISRKVVTDKFQSFMTLEIKEDVDETSPMGFKLSGDVQNMWKLELISIMIEVLVMAVLLMIPVSIGIEYWLRGE